jgi:hypothetical protein
MARELNLAHRAAKSEKILGVLGDHGSHCSAPKEQATWLPNLWIKPPAEGMLRN